MAPTAYANRARGVAPGRDDPIEHVAAHGFDNRSRGWGGISRCFEHACSEAELREVIDAVGNVAGAMSGAAWRYDAPRRLAYADSGHVTDVATGENRGVRLHHDHVVRSLHGPYPVDTGGTAVAELSLVPQRDGGRSPVLIAFVQDSKSGDALQTLELPACW